MSKLLEGQQWSELNSDDVKLLVAKVMSKYSKDGQETNTTSDHKKVLQQWFRFLKTRLQNCQRLRAGVGIQTSQGDKTNQNWNSVRYRNCRRLGNSGGKKQTDEEL